MLREEKTKKSVLRIAIAVESLIQKRVNVLDTGVSLMTQYFVMSETPLCETNKLLYDTIET